jgi:hypothetical protein
LLHNVTAVVFDTAIALFELQLIVQHWLRNDAADSSGLGWNLPRWERDGSSGASHGNSPPDARRLLELCAEVLSVGHAWTRAPYAWREQLWLAGCPRSRAMSSIKSETEGEKLCGVGSKRFLNLRGGLPH